MRTGIRTGPAAIVLALAAMTASAPLHAQGVGLPGQSRKLPIEINATNGIEWQQKNKTYIARGNARAAQGDVSLRADTLTAYYREKPDGGSEIWRIDADGDVRIAAPAQRARGDRGVYDVSRGVMVLTGRELRLETETDVLTARDSLEYWEKKSLAVARGDAVAVRGENRLRADILTAHLKADKAGKTRVNRVDAVDNVVITTPDEIVRARRGVYDVETGIATLTGSVKITRGKNQLNGERAEVNLNTGVSRLFGGGSQGVQGIFTPEDVSDGERGKSKAMPDNQTDRDER